MDNISKNLVGRMQAFFIFLLNFYHFHFVVYSFVTLSLTLNWSWYAQNCIVRRIWSSLFCLFFLYLLCVWVMCCYRSLPFYKSNTIWIWSISLLSHSFSILVWWKNYSAICFKKCSLYFLYQCLLGSFIPLETLKLNSNFIHSTKYESFKMTEKINTKSVQHKTTTANQSEWERERVSQEPHQRKPSNFE